jgi:predicted TIM-barrel fold metal-dependent hydrolase
MIGRCAAPPEGAPTTADELLRVMDRYGIAEALVHHAIAREQSPAEGNALLLEEVRGHDRLHPCAVVMPAHSGEVPPPDEYVAQLLDQGFRAARMFPARQFISLAMWSCRELYHELAERRVPLFLDFENPAWSTPRTDWDAIEALLSAYARLPVILVNEGMAADRNLQALMAQYDNLLIETSYYATHGGLETLAHKHGASRALFGTGLPYLDPGCPLAMIAYADLPPEQKALVAGDRLRELLGQASAGKRRGAIGFGARAASRASADDWPTQLRPPPGMSPP